MTIKKLFKDKNLIKLVLAFLVIVSSSSYAGIYSTGEPAFKWNKKKVIVCWQDDNPLQENDFNKDDFKNLKSYSGIVTLSDTLKKRIQSLVQTEFTVQRTGITFIGWQSCKGMNNYDLIILTANNKQGAYNGYASLGRADIENYQLKNKSKKNFIYLNLYMRDNIQKITFTEYVLMTGLHEFGHAAGLRHEHIREIGNDGCFLQKEARGRLTSFYSIYDPSSIMNYCYLQFISETSGLKFYRLENWDEDAWERLMNHEMNVIHWSYDWIYQDDSIFKFNPVSKIKGLLKYKVQIGLSKGDVHGLKCMYVYDSELGVKICHQNFKP